MKHRKRARLARTLALGERKHHERIEAIRESGRHRKMIGVLFNADQLSQHPSPDSLHHAPAE